MSKEEIVRFNHVAGNAPVGLDGSPEDVWKQIEKLAELNLEEAQEMYDAAVARDIVEVLDGSSDNWYLREYMDELLKALDIDVPGAKWRVCQNNSSKYTTSEDYALDSWAEYAKKGVPAEVVEVEYEGKTYYTIKVNNKVMKLKFHSRPNLSECVPDSTIKFLKGE